MKSSPKQTDYPIYSEGKLSKRKQLFHLSLRNRLPALRQTPISESDTDSQNDERQALKRIVVFFAVMLILTLVARGTSSAIRPVVTTQQAKAGTISQSVQSSGSITTCSAVFTGIRLPPYLSKLVNMVPWLLPAQWSNLGFWLDLVNILNERLNETLSLVPTTRDVFAKRQAIEFTLWLLACLGALGLSVRVLKQR